MSLVPLRRINLVAHPTIAEFGNRFGERRQKFRSFLF